MVVTLSLSLLSALAAGLAAGNEDVDLQSTPAYLILGTYDAEILRCDYHNPTRCEVFYKTSEPDAIYTSLVHGEYFFAGLGNGKLLRCEWYSNSSCTIFRLSGKHIASLAVARGYLYTGHDDGLMSRCMLNLLRNCVSVRNFTESVKGIYLLEKYIYVATTTSLFSCSDGEEEFDCSRVKMKFDSGLWRVSHLGNTFIKISDGDSDVWYYNQTSSESMIYKDKSSLSGVALDVAVFRRRIYVLLCLDGIKTFTEHSNIFTDFVRHGDRDKIYSRISFAYAVRHMSKVEGGGGHRLPAAAFRVEQRWLVEASVVGGALVDARGGRVDTRRSGWAVFAMGPDGQILLTTEHTSGLVDIPSFFAGGPVAGAGEMHVEDGVIKRIVACSVHYRPDNNLNRQVVDELYKKGYTKADEIILEECDYKCDKDEADVHLDL